MQSPGSVRAGRTGRRRTAVHRQRSHPHADLFALICGPRDRITPIAPHDRAPSGRPRRAPTHPRRASTRRPESAIAGSEGAILGESARLGSEGAI
eukprot:3390179-Prymnesium_polylepis.2